MLLFVVVLSLLMAVATAFVRTTRSSVRNSNSNSKLYYNYDKKLPEGQKKTIGRIWKNIIFPGIYQEYADTAEPIKEIKISTFKNKSRYTEEEITESKAKVGTFAAADARTIPTYAPAQTQFSKVLAKVAKPVGFVAPTPKKSASGTAGGVGPIDNVASYPKAKKALVLYEYEGCGECKKVREAIAMLDLIVEYRPCPGTTTGFSDQLNTACKGRRAVPFMQDTNPSMYRPELLGSNAIVKHLFETYGPGADAAPKKLTGGGIGGKTAAKVKANARPDNIKMKPITLYGWEGAKFVAPVRKELDALGLPHLFINCAPGSTNRAALSKKTKNVDQVPYIEDPNTGVNMFESADIVKYLNNVYTISN